MIRQSGSGSRGSHVKLPTEITPFSTIDEIIEDIDGLINFLYNTWSESFEIDSRNPFYQGALKTIEGWIKEMNDAQATRFAYALGKRMREIDQVENGKFELGLRIANLLSKQYRGTRTPELGKALGYLKGCRTKSAINPHRRKMADEAAR